MPDNPAIVINVKPISRALGAELSGFDLSKRLDSEIRISIRQLLFEHLFIVFRDQSLTPNDLLNTAGMIGEVGHYPFAQAMPDYPGVVEIIKEPEQTSNFGGI